ncbi:MAG: helix-turn-helix domain-containing protein [Thermoplasmata archaeon]|jgi:predicted DNA binding protein|nr:helix-turn-helix domain-containing protein [Thermoplasmata archaeon]
MMEAVVSLKIPQNWMSEIPEKHPVTIKVINRVPYSEKGVRDLVEIAGPEDVMEEVLTDIKKNPLVSKVDTTMTDKGKIVGAVTTSRCDICRILTDADVFLVSAESRGGGKVDWTIILTDKDVLKTIFDHLKNKSVEAELVKLTKIDDKETLTERQDKITHVAFERGYFDYPKRISLRELARMFDVSPSTLSEILRKGQRKIVLDYFKKQRQTI